MWGEANMSSTDHGAIEGPPGRPGQKGETGPTGPKGAKGNNLKWTLVQNLLLFFWSSSLKMSLFDWIQVNEVSLDLKDTEDRKETEVRSLWLCDFNVVKKLDDGPGSSYTKATWTVFQLRTFRLLWTFHVWSTNLRFCCWRNDDS